MKEVTPASSRQLLQNQNHDSRPIIQSTIYIIQLNHFSQSPHCHPESRFIGKGPVFKAKLH